MCTKSATNSKIVCKHGVKHSYVQVCKRLPLYMNIVYPTSPTTKSATVIFLHEAGDTGAGMKEWLRCVLGEDLTFCHAKILYPTAPKRPYTPHRGVLSSVWFDRYKKNPFVPEHEESLNSASKILSELIRDEVAKGIRIHRIVIGGFSMGGSLALHVAYRTRLNLGGVFVLSGYLNKDSAVYSALGFHKKFASIPPLFMCHGQKDPLVLLDWAENTFEQLKRCGIRGEFHPYSNMLHEMKKEEILLLKDWIIKQLERR